MIHAYKYMQLTCILEFYIKETVVKLIFIITKVHHDRHSSSLKLAFSSSQGSVIASDAVHPDDRSFMSLPWYTPSGPLANTATVKAPEE